MAVFVANGQSFVVEAADIADYGVADEASVTAAAVEVVG